MSNIIDDWVADDVLWWTTKYPFLTVKDNSVHTWLKIGSTDYHWLSDIYPGWVNTFGECMCDELLCALDKYVDDFIIIQVKEKFAEIRVYWYWQDREYTEQEQGELKEISNSLNTILHKYANISYQTCVECGKPATRYSRGWTLPYCSECFKSKG